VIAEWIDKLIRAYTDLIGDWFWVIMLLFPVVLIYLKTQSVMYASMFLLFAGFVWGVAMPGPLQIVGYIICSIVIAGFLYKMLVGD
jgi:hypothetical protein